MKSPAKDTRRKEFADVQKRMTEKTFRERAKDIYRKRKHKKK